MSMRLALLAAASPLAMLALPAQAQVDDRYAEVEDIEVIETYSEPVVQDISGWQAEAPGASYSHGDAGDGYADDYYAEDYEADEVEWADERGDHHRMRRHGGHHRGHRAAAAGPVRQLTYGPAERAEWLAQCRALHASYDEPVYIEPERDRDGGIIGSVIGAVAGGVIGNQVTNRHRLAGTLIGAGVGGLAGAVIGSIIDGADDDDERVILAPQEPGFDYCEAYLINYERGYGVPQQATYAPVVMFPVAQPTPTVGHAMHGGTRRIIVEEVEIEADAPRRHTARRTIHRQVEGDKRIPLE